MRAIRLISVVVASATALYLIQPVSALGLPNQSVPASNTPSAPSLIQKSSVDLSVPTGNSGNFSVQAASANLQVGLHGSDLATANSGPTAVPVVGDSGQVSAESVGSTGGNSAGPAHSQPVPSTPTPSPTKAATDTLVREGSAKNRAVHTNSSTAKTRDTQSGSVDTRVSSAVPQRTTKEAPSPAGQERPAEQSVITRFVDRIPQELLAALLVLAILTTIFGGVSLRERRGRRRSERVALIDPLTGLSNRLAFERRLSQEWKRTRRHGGRFGLLLIDVDDFKQVNDRQGHAVGDQVLREIATKLSSRMRETDLLARFGGDEFVAICPETSTAGLARLAQNLEERASHALDFQVGLSIGIAQVEPGDEQPSDLIPRADASMYRRKHEHAIHCH